MDVWQDPPEPPFTGKITYFITPHNGARRQRAYDVQDGVVNYDSPEDTFPLNPVKLSMMAMEDFLETVEEPRELREVTISFEGQGAGGVFKEYWYHPGLRMVLGGFKKHEIWSPLQENGHERAFICFGPRRSSYDI